MAQSALRDISQTWWKDIKPQAPQKPVGQQMSDLLGGVALATAPFPVIGDVAGAVSDAAMYAAYPEERTMLNAGMSLAGLLPFMPGPGGVRAVEKAAEGLDMSQAARMQRAAEQGFDERVFYHGGASDIDEFKAGRRGNYFTDDPRIADIYASNAEKRWPGINNASPNVIPVRLKGPALVVSDQRGGNGGWYQDNLAETLGVDLSALPTVKRPQALRDEAKKQGYGFIEIRDMSDLGGTQTQFVALDPSNIRSVNAEFNPANRGSADLMAGVMGGAVGLSALRNINQQEEK